MLSFLASENWNNLKYPKWMTYTKRKKKWFKIHSDGSFPFLFTQNDHPNIYSIYSGATHLSNRSMDLEFIELIEWEFLFFRSDLPLDGCVP